MIWLLLLIEFLIAVSCNDYGQDYDDFISKNSPGGNRGEHYDLYDSESKLPRGGKWPEFIKILNKEVDKVDSVKIKSNWDENVHKWAAHAKKKETPKTVLRTSEPRGEPANGPEKKIFQNAVRSNRPPPNYNGPPRGPYLNYKSLPPNSHVAQPDYQSPDYGDTPPRYGFPSNPNMQPSNDKAPSFYPNSPPNYNGSPSNNNGLPPDFNNPFSPNHFPPNYNNPSSNYNDNNDDELPYQNGPPSNYNGPPQNVNGGRLTNPEMAPSDYYGRPPNYSDYDGRPFNYDNSAPHQNIKPPSVNLPPNFVPPPVTHIIPSPKYNLPSDNLPSPGSMLSPPLPKSQNPYNDEIMKSLLDRMADLEGQFKEKLTKTEPPKHNLSPEYKERSNDLEGKLKEHELTKTEPPKHNISPEFKEQTNNEPDSSKIFPTVDDFNSPIRWVPSNSTETDDGLAKVTNKETGKNSQLLVNGIYYVPIADYSLERLGLTTKSTTIASMLTPGVNNLRTVIDNVDMNATNTLDWLDIETALGRSQHDVTCNGAACNSRCQTTSCQTTCEGDTCRAGCVGAGCISSCKGPGCYSMCIGDRCSARCEGISCDSRCRGKDCDADCYLFSCYKTKNAVAFHQGAGTYDQWYL